MTVHRAGFYYVIVGTFILYLGSLALDILALLTAFDIQNGIIPTDPWTQESKVPNVFDIPTMAYLIEIAVVLWQIIWLGYGLSTLCRKDLASGGYLYYAPPFMPITMYAMFGTGIISKIAHIFASTYGYVEFALAFRALVSFTLFLALSFGTTALYRNVENLSRSGQIREVKLTRGLVHNGIGFYLGYNDTLVTVGLYKMLANQAGLSEELAALIAFGVFLASIVIFFIIELTVWDKYARHVVSYYVSTIVVLGFIAFSVFQGNSWSMAHYVFLVTVVLACVGFLGKLIAICVRDTKMEDRLRQGGTSVLVKK